jgi:hypothetical protein
MDYALAQRNTRSSGAATKLFIHHENHAFGLINKKLATLEAPNAKILMTTEKITS